MKEIIKIEGMSCASCSSTIEKNINKMPGVKEAVVSLLEKELYVEFEGITKESIEDKVKSLGYSVKAEKKNNNTLLISILFTLPLFILAMLPMFGITLIKNPYIYATTQLILSLPVIIVNNKIFRKGSKLLIKNNPNMDSLIFLGTSAAFIFSIYEYIKLMLGNLESVHHLYFETTAVILTLTIFGKHLEEKAKSKSSGAIKKLLGLAPKTAIILRENNEVLENIENIKKNDIVIIKPGSKIPLDGIIIEGNSFVDESMLTGESVAVLKEEGLSVFGGTINKSGYFKYKVTSNHEEGVLSQIVRSVENAQKTKAPIAQFADFISGYFVKIVLVLALITGVIWYISTGDVELTMSFVVAILIIACPCALGLATPVAIMVSTGKSAELGTLFKNAKSLENLNKADVIVFDKTGTITIGKPVVTEVIGDDEIVLIAASLEAKSEHPLAEAILLKNEKELKEISDFEYEVGYGLNGKIDGHTYFVGNIKLIEKNNIQSESYLPKYEELSNDGRTVVFVADKERVLGLIAISDQIKEETKAVISYFKNRGIKTIMLTGDNKNAANFIGKYVNIDEVISEVKPLDKAAVIEKLKKKYKVIVMVGDGINDAPALATATIGVAIGNGTDIAIESSDIVLINGNIKSLVNSFELSKMTLKNIKQNLFLAFIYNILAIPIAAGILYPTFKLNPMIAALAMSFSSISVVLNSLRIGKFRGGK